MTLTGWIGPLLVGVAFAAFALQLIRIGRGAAPPRSLVPEALQDLALAVLGGIAMFRPEPPVRIALVVIAAFSLAGWAATRRWTRPPIDTPG
jgi:hypothetical protein